MVLRRESVRVFLVKYKSVLLRIYVSTHNMNTYRMGR